MQINSKTCVVVSQPNIPWFFLQFFFIKQRWFYLWERKFRLIHRLKFVLCDSVEYVASTDFLSFRCYKFTNEIHFIKFYNFTLFINLYLWLLKSIIELFAFPLNQNLRHISIDHSLCQRLTFQSKKFKHLFPIMNMDHLQLFQIKIKLK